MQKWLNSQNKDELEIVYNSLLSLKLFWNLLIYTKQALESPLFTFSSFQQVEKQRPTHILKILTKYFLLLDNFNIGLLVWTDKLVKWKINVEPCSCVGCECRNNNISFLYKYCVDKLIKDKNSPLILGGIYYRLL